MEVIDVIRDVKEILSDADSWRKGHYSTDSDGYYVHTRSEQACKWCVMGAVYKVAGYETPLSIRVESYLDEMVADWNHESITKYNDHDDTSHNDIINLLDNAMEML